MSDSTVFRRVNDRAADALRPLTIRVGAMKFAEGSAQIDLGDTRVLVSASVENRVPPFLKDSGSGWMTAEYAMLPRATHTRSAREVSKGKPSGRSTEIQRLIGRSLRAVVDLTALPDRTVVVDCDVLQADGGTRTASITAAYVAMVEALGKIFLTGEIERWPLQAELAAISAGVVRDTPLLDLEYVEDQEAQVDMNIVGTSDGSLVEVQGTGERRSFARSEMDRILDLAFKGIDELAQAQRAALAPILEEVEAVQAKGRRQPTPPKDEKHLWGAPE